MLLSTTVRRSPQALFLLTSHPFCAPVPAAAIGRWLRALIDGPVEEADPHLPERLLDAVVSAVAAGTFPSTWPSVRRWLDRHDIGYQEWRSTVTERTPSEGTDPP